MRVAIVFATVSAVVSLGAFQQPASPDDGYLQWSHSQAERIGRSTRVNGRVGGALDLRVIHTEHSYNYKLRATWLTGEVIRASARLAQISGGLGSDETRKLVSEAESAGDIILLIEIDPREGSGVIPLDWTAFLGEQGRERGQAGVVKGEILPSGRNLRALSGAYRRDYNYDAFWVAFPSRDVSGVPVFTAQSREAELVVRIHNKEGRVSWPVPETARRRVNQ